MTLDAKVNPFEFLQEELTNEDQSRRLDAMKRLKYIAWHMGPKRVVDELIPFLYEIAKTEPSILDDEFLFQLAEQLGVFCDYIDEKFEGLIPVLEFLATQEETVIRDKAIEVLAIISGRAPHLVSDQIVPLLQRLTGSDWFTPRVSACSLFAAVYPHANDSQKSEMRKWYGVLCSDDTPMVRRAAAEKLKYLVAVIDKQSIMNDIIPVYRQLAQEDTQDAIRVSCVYTTMVLIEKIFYDNPDENKAHTLLVITNAAEDRSWRVRLTVAKHFNLICKYMGAEITSTFLLNPFVQLMKDSEQEVRKAALEAVEECIPYLTIEQLQNFIVPQFQSLGLDSSQVVRASLASIIASVARALGRELTNKHLLHTVGDLMKDEYHEVRLNVVSHTAEICQVLGMDVLTHALLNTIQDRIMDNQWRIRQSVIMQIPSLAKQFGPDLFREKLQSLYMSSLHDSVFAVREAAINNLAIISENFGSPWARENLLDKIKELNNSTASYSSRLTCLCALPKLCPVLQPDEIVSKLIPTLITCTKDPVPNVRFIACIALSEIITKFNVSNVAISTTIKPALNELLQDTDIDVKYYALSCLGECK